jgi:hypothetical protein
VVAIEPKFEAKFEAEFEAEFEVKFEPKPKLNLRRAAAESFLALATLYHRRSS